jgi:hypothetical protein
MGLPDGLLTNGITRKGMRSVPRGRWGWLRMNGLTHQRWSASRRDPDRDRRSPAWLATW